MLQFYARLKSAVSLDCKHTRKVCTLGQELLKSEFEYPYTEVQPAKGGNLVTPKLKQLAVCWLYCQGLLACAWWVLLFYAPSLRRHFLPGDAPDSTLLAFMVPDLLLFIAGALVAATGLVRGQRWGWYALLVIPEQPLTQRCIVWRCRCCLMADLREPC